MSEVTSIAHFQQSNLTNVLYKLNKTNTIYNFSLHTVNASSESHFATHLHCSFFLRCVFHKQHHVCCHWSFFSCMMKYREIVEQISAAKYNLLQMKTTTLVWFKQSWPKYNQYMPCWKLFCLFSNMPWDSR